MIIKSPHVHGHGTSAQHCNSTRSVPAAAMRDSAVSPFGIIYESSHLSGTMPVVQITKRQETRHAMHVNCTCFPLYLVILRLAETLFQHIYLDLLCGSSDFIEYPKLFLIFVRIFRWSAQSSKLNPSQKWRSVYEITSGFRRPY